MPSVIREINDDACIQLYCLHRQKKAESDKRCHFQTQGALPGLFATRVHYRAWTKPSEDMTAITLSAFVEVRSPRSQQLQLVHLRQDRFGQAESKGW